MTSAVETNPTGQFRAVVPDGTLGSDRLFGLDALRGIAALCVVLLHLHVLMPEVPVVMGRGYLAVDFFFALSGYVMARTYEPRLMAGLRGAAFLTARFRRLWPTMAIGAILFLPFLEEGTRGESISLQTVALLNFVLLPSLASNNLFPLNVPAWSIFFELLANALHGSLLWRLGEHVLAVLCLAALAGLTLAGRLYGNLDLGSDQGEMLAGLLRVIFSYGMGVLIWRCCGQRRLNSFAALLALIAMPLCLAVPGADTPGAWKMDLLFIAVLSPLMLIAGLSLRHGRRLAEWAGTISFPLYAVHYPVLYWGRDWGLPPLAALCACIVAAALTHFVVTQPARWVRRS